MLIAHRLMQGQHQPVFNINGRVCPHLQCVAPFPSRPLADRHPAFCTPHITIITIATPVPLTYKISVADATRDDADQDLARLRLLQVQVVDRERQLGSTRDGSSNLGTRRDCGCRCSTARVSTTKERGGNGRRGTGNSTRQHPGELAALLERC